MTLEFAYLGDFVLALVEGFWFTASIWLVVWKISVIVRAFRLVGDAG